MAVTFNGSSQYMAYGAALITAVPYAISAIFNGSSYAATRSGIAGVYKSSGTTNFFWINANSTPRFELSVPNITQTTVAVNLSTGVWYVGTGTSASATSRAAYLNGANKATNATNVTPTGLDTTRIALWLYPGQTYYFTGSLADVAFWNAVLTDQEAASLGAKFSPLLVRPVSIVGYYPLGGAITPPLSTRDVCKQANMTAYNTPTAADHPKTIYPCDACCC